MAQHDYNLANQSGADFRADLNNALSAIVTVNSGATAPSTTFAHQLWVDTSSSVLKIRNSANDAWVTTGVSITADNTFAGNLTGNVTGNVTGDVTGNADTATALETARTINGASFDGTANISFGTDSVSEGSSNLYFTNARVESYLDAGTSTPTFASAVINTSLTGSAILDDDTFGTASVTTVATSESIKAYVDSQIGSVDTLAEILLNGNTTGGTDIAFGDNDKATFGNSDLSIYHDGFSSYIVDDGTGDLYIRGADDIRIQGGNGAGSWQSAITVNEAGSVDLFHNGDLKAQTTSSGVDISGRVTADGLDVGTTSDAYTQVLINSSTTGESELRMGDTDTDAGSIAYTNSDDTMTFRAAAGARMSLNSTGIDVTGTVTSDGLTVDGEALLQSSTGAHYLKFYRNDSTINAGNALGQIWFGGSDEGDFDEAASIKASAFSAWTGTSSPTQLDFYTTANTTTTPLKRATIAHNGDIAFYDDTGTTQGFFWDSSAESLGIGTTSPVSKLDVFSIGDVIATFSRDGSDGDAVQIFNGAAGTTKVLGLGGVGNNGIITNQYGNIQLAPSGTTRATISSTGIDVTGTVNADGLTVQGDAYFDTNNAGRALYITRYGTVTSESAALNVDDNDLILDSIQDEQYGGYVFKGTHNGTGTRTRLNIDNNGDISFYDDTGTSQALFWDASAESLRVPTLTISDGGITTTAAAGDHTVFNSTGADADFRVRTGANTHSLYVQGNTGNVGIGTDSPSAKLSIHAAVNNPAIEIVPTTDENSADTAVLRLWGTRFGTANRYSEIRNVTDGSTANNELAFNTNGSEALRIDSSQRVGIGTSSPTGLLTVDGGTGVSTSGGTLIVKQKGDTSNDGIAITSSNSVSHRIWKDASGKLNIGSFSYPSSFVQDLNGNVGIGTTSPSAALEVNSGGGIHLTDNTAGRTLIIKPSLTGSVHEFTSDNTAAGYAFSNSSSELMRVNSTGLGIGTSSPDKLLDVSSNSAPTIRISNTRNDSNWDTDPVFGALEFYSSDASGSGASVRASVKAESFTTFGNATDLVFRNGDAQGVQQENFRINYLGRVGIGTASPDTALHVVGVGSTYIKSERTVSGSEGHILLGAATNQNQIISRDATTGGKDLTFTIGASERMRLNSTGLGIGTASPSDKLDVGGALRLTANISFDSNKSGRIYKASNHGLAFHGVTGTANDFAMFNPSGQLMVVNPTGTNDVSLIPTADGSVGIGTDSPARNLVVNSSGTSTLQVTNDTSGLTTGNGFQINHFTSGATRIWNYENGYMAFATNNSERGRFDSSGNFLVGKTAINTDSVGFEARATGLNAMVRDGGETLVLGRKTSNGSILSFRKDGATIGSLGSYLSNRLFVGSGDTNLNFHPAGDAVYPSGANGNTRDGAINLGAGFSRFKDLHLSGTGYFGTSVGIGTDSPSAKLDVSSATGSSSITPTEMKISSSTQASDWSLTEPWGVLGFYSADTSGGGAGNLAEISANMENTVGGFASLDFKLQDPSQSYAKTSWLTLKNSSSFATRQVLIEADGGLYVEGNVGIGTDSPARNLHVHASNFTDLHLTNDTTGATASDGTSFTAINSDIYLTNREAGNMVFQTSGSERARFLSGGAFLIGKTALAVNNTGLQFNGGLLAVTKDGGEPLILNRKTTDGVVADFRKDNTSVGNTRSFGGDLIIQTGITGLRFNDANDAIHPVIVNGSVSDGATDLGLSNARFKDIYATNGTIQTSDINEKQDIEDISEAETRVAVAAKGLLKKYRWKSAVADKGDDARIHFGIMAQDLQQAFSAEGLDAGDYGMFISSTWTDETTGEEKTRLGVRYNELLAFIIAAI